LTSRSSKSRESLFSSACSYFAYSSAAPGGAAWRCGPASQNPTTRPSTSQPTSYDCTTPCDFRGPFAQIAPGLGGGKLSLGWARVTGKTDEHGALVNAAFIGSAYKVTVLQTWGDLGWVEEGRTYAGFEFDLPVARANLGIGLLYRVDGGAGGRWLVTGGAGWGF